MRTLLSSLLISSILLASCGGAGTKAEKAGQAMADTACLLFSEDVDFSQIESMTSDIMTQYGFSSPEEVDAYLTEIRGTEELNQVSEAARNQLEKSCGDALSTSGVSAADLAEAMVSE